MRIVVHDYSGHPFQLQLSRALAKLGHNVLHQYCSSYATGKGAVTRLPDDPPTFDVQAVAMAGQFARYSPLKRLLQELRYGVTLGRSLRRSRPDVVIMCNIPLLAHLVSAAITRASGIPMLFWHQDVYSHAIATAARRKLGRLLGGPVGLVADRAERWIARHSAHVVAIAEEFRPVLHRWGVPEERITVIPNWAALEEMPLRPRENQWARAHDLVGRETVVYSGTLGLKHNPQVFTVLAQALRSSRPDARVVVVSEGQGREWLEHQRTRQGLDNVVLLDYQPYAQLPDVLASADILVAVLEPDASRYSVPSKVLNYLCAGRPVLAVMPIGNGAASTLVTAKAGLVIPPDDERAMTTALLELLADPDRRAAMGRAGRHHAERTFAIQPVARRFAAVLESAGRR